MLIIPDLTLSSVTSEPPECATSSRVDATRILYCTSKEPVRPRVELILKIIIILLIIFLGFIKSKPC